MNQKTNSQNSNASRKKSLLTVKDHHGKPVNFFRYHSLSLVTLGILLLWIILYAKSDPNKHGGAFFGNAIADWSGSVVFIIATKFLFEKGSAESRSPHERKHHPLLNFFRCHSLTIFLIITGLIWAGAYFRMDPLSKWGQVVGNIVSEWVQMLGLVLLTKHLIERHSKESH
ncbi:MAG: hypothetical protein JWQ71_1300 [Pedosphaera sp.]|nr:hypothetical protein [Pedosphaera sp.]